MKKRFQLTINLFFTVAIFFPTLIFASESKEEKDCLFDALVHESHHDDLFDILYIAAVIYNRKQSNLYPNTLCGVINQPYQFSYLLKNKIDRESYSYQRKKIKVKLLYMKILKNSNNESIIDATHYHARYVFPSWSKKMIKVAETKGHLFFKSPR